MSRHRDIRNLDLDEEYDEAYDDTVYGRSVDEYEFGTSPSTEQYLYNHSRDNFGTFFPTSEGITEEEGYNDDQAGYQKPELSPEDEARLQSVLDQLRGILGDSITDDEMTAATIEGSYNMERILDKLLRQQHADSAAVAIVSNGATGGGWSGEQPRKQGSGAAGNRSAQAAGPAARRGNKFKTTDVGGSSRGAGHVTKVVTPSAKSVTRGFEVARPLGSNKASGAPLDEGGTPSKPSAGSTPSKPVKLPTRQRDVAVDVTAKFNAACSSVGKQLLNLVVVGHVDAGKSTLTGHLLYKQGTVSKRMMHKYEQESKKAGKQSMYAWVMDDTEEERSRGVTVDVAERSFETASNVVNILDAPGHKDFIPNMISGAARADVALLVVDASTGEFEAGFESNGQTREHAMLIKSLGVSQIAVAVNKLDTVQWAESRYNDIKSSLTTFLKTVGYRSSDVQYVPCSGLTGENLVEVPKEAALTSWYRGPTILQAIDSMKPPEREVLRPTRFSISDVFKGGSSNVCVTGKLHTGYIQPGDKLLLLPHTLPLTVKDVVSSSGVAAQLFAGDSGTLTVSGAADPDVVQVGCFLCDPASPMPQANWLRARVVVFGVTVPIIRGTQVEFHHQTLCEPATVRKLVAQINKSTGEVTKKNPRVLAKQTAGVLELELARPVCVETFKDNKELGRFMLRQQGNTVAAGLVTELLGNTKERTGRDPAF